MKSIIIFYEHVAREYESCIRLKNELEKDNKIKAYVFSLHFQMIDAFTLSLKESIKMLIVPYAYKERSIHQYSYFLRKSPIPIILNLHHEQVSSKYDEHKHLPSDDITKNRVFHISWTNTFKSNLIKSGVKEELIFVTGNIRNDPLFRPKNNKKTSFANSYGLALNKKWIFLCESGTHIFDYNSNNRAININVLINERNFKEDDLLLWNKHIKKSMKVFHNQLEQLSELFFENYELIYRAHPGETVNAQINKNVRIINDKSIIEWFDVVDLCISRHSTVLFEAEASGVPTVCYNPANTPKRILIQGFENYRQIENLNAINQKLISLAKSDLGEKCVYEKYIVKVDGQSGLRVAKTVSKLLGNEMIIYDRSAIKLKYFRTLFRKILSNIFAKIIIKAKLSFFENFSRSIIVLRNDIPPVWRYRYHFK